MFEARPLKRVLNVANRIFRALSGGMSVNVGPDRIDIAERRRRYCVGFLELEMDGEACRSSVSMDRAIAWLHAQIDGPIQRAETMDARRPTRPSVPTLRSWLRRFEAHGYGAFALHPRDGQCARRLHPAVEASMMSCVSLYASRKRPTIAVCHTVLRARVSAINARRIANGWAPLTAPSQSTFARRIRDLDRAFVLAARHGEAVARRVMGSPRRR